MQDKHVVLAIGFTGSGKSTLLNALVSGPDSLKMTKIKKKLVVESKMEEAVFKIGQSKS